VLIFLDLVALVALVEAAAVVVLVVPPVPAIWKAMLPPKGPALLLLATFNKQKFVAPLVASLPVQVVSAGIFTLKVWIYVSDVL